MSKTNKPKKLILRIFYIFLILFLIWNITSAIQGYAFTHYADQSQNTGEQSMISQLLTGATLYRPESKTVPERPYQTVNIPAGEGKSLEAWYMKTDSVSKGLFIMFHGYMDNHESLLAEAYPLLEMGYDVLLPNFMGSGKSYGKTTTIGYREAQNVKQAYDYAKNDLKADHISLLGMSMGAAAISKAMHDYDLPVDCVVLEAIYGRMVDAALVRLGTFPVVGKPAAYTIVFWGGVINGFNAFSMNPEKFVADIKVPTLMLYGGEDKWIPVAEAQRIFDNIGSNTKELYMFADANHEYYGQKWTEEWANVISAFLEKNVEQ